MQAPLFETVNGWTVADYPPTNKWGGHSEQVLICIKKQYQAQPDMQLAYYDHDRGQWRNNFGPIENVIYWRPLPEPPKSW